MIIVSFSINTVPNYSLTEPLTRRQIMHLNSSGFRPARVSRSETRWLFFIFQKKNNKLHCALDLNLPASNFQWSHSDGNFKANSQKVISWNLTWQDDGGELQKLDEWWITRWETDQSSDWGELLYQLMKTWPDVDWTRKDGNKVACFYHNNEHKLIQSPELLLKFLN